MTAKAEDDQEAQKLVTPLVNELKARFGEAVYTTDPDVTLEMSVIELLKQNGYSLAVAESCTGGCYLQG